MQISAINQHNNFKGEVIDLIPTKKGCFVPKGESDFVDKMETFDYKTAADVLNQGKQENKVSAPAKFFLTSALIGLASYFAAKKVSIAALKTIESKLGLEKPLNKLGDTVARGVSSLKGRPTPEITNIKTFVIHNSNKALDVLARSFESMSKKGVTEAEKEAFVKLMGTKAKYRALYARNALNKITGSVLGIGTAGVSVANRYKDADENGIPDKMEKKGGFSILKDCQEALPKVATVCDLIS